MQQKPSFFITFSFVKLLKILANISRNNLSTWTCLVCVCVCMSVCNWVIGISLVVTFSSMRFLKLCAFLKLLSAYPSTTRVYIEVPLWRSSVSSVHLFMPSCLLLYWPIAKRLVSCVCVCVCTTGDELFRVKWDLLCSYLAPPFYSWTLLE